MKIAVLGAGSWGIALAALLHKKGHALRMWEFDPNEAASLREKREHPLKLPGIKIPLEVDVTNDIAEAVDGAECMLCAVPAQTMRSSMRAVTAATAQSDREAVQVWTIVSKGIETGTSKFMSEVMLEEVPGLTRDKIVVLSGPSHAEEVSRGIPTTVVAASDSPALAEVIQREFSSETFRIYTNPDMTGVELAGGVKNVIAVAAGICDGLGFGDNTKGALLTRGLAEMIRLGERLGARHETFSGLAGIGDLVTTCVSRHSRNRRIGEMIGSGLSLEQALGKMVMVAEGVETTRSVHQLAGRLGIEMPITEQVYLALFEGKSPLLATRDLMLRESKPERW